MINTPYSTPQPPPLLDDTVQARAAQPLWKAFWLVFVPTCLGANVLSVMGLLFWKTDIGKGLQSAVTLASPFNLPLLLWLTLAVPFLVATPLGFRALCRAAPAKRFSALNSISIVLGVLYCAYVAYMLGKGLLRVL